MTTATDAEILARLDFDHQVPCEGVAADECDQAAEWRVTFAGLLLAGRVEIQLLCTDCRDWHVDHLRACDRCGLVLHIKRVEAIR